MGYRSLVLIGCFLLAASGAAKRKALIVDGQNNHKWQETTPVLKRLLEQTGLFEVAVATTPPKGADMSAFHPDFKAFDVVVSNYNGDAWPAGTQAAFEAYVRGGGGLVVYHAADNAFPEWAQYNEMIGLGGWGNRKESAGPYVRYREGKIVAENKPGPGGHHGKAHEFRVEIRDSAHPITAGLPRQWMHAQDELYDSLRGPARNMTVLATAFSDTSTGGTGEHEPILMVLSYGKGRIFHTTLGHYLPALECLGFAVTFQRGVEWAATGQVTQPVPEDFPTPTGVRSRPLGRD
ncbi:MAG: ThuA domain-containing protein [Candidatus Solibacter usitatus]|nr:ThuA domain-containing protein [Candidatus Solibacter usitatus]